MAYPNLYRQIEQQYGEPMETLLPRMCNELGTWEAVANQWQVSIQTIWKWGRRIGLRCVWVANKKPVTGKPTKN